MIFSLATSAFSAKIPTGIDSETVDKINSALNFVNPQKEQYGLGIVDFSTLSIGNAIPTYEYTNNVLSPLAISYYPLTSNGDLVALAIISGESANITTALVDKIKGEVTPEESFALVFDMNTCYVYTLDGLSSIKNFDNVDSRSSIGNDESVAPSQIDSYQAVQSVGYSASAQNNSSSLVTNNGTNPAPESSAYITLHVPFVTQNPPSNICWAATTACIGNYLKPSGTQYSAQAIAIYHYGMYNWNYGGSADMCVSILNSLYGVTTYTAHPTTVPSDDTIFSAISAGHPLYSRWSYENGYHAMALCGIDALAGYISVMDPQNGFGSGLCGKYYDYSAGRYIYSYSYLLPDVGISITLMGYAA